MTNLDDTLAHAAGVLREARSIVALGHVAPDGDALGSALALAMAAGDAGIDAVASFGDPFLLSSAFDFLPTERLVPAADLPEAPDVVVAFDTANFERLGNAGAVAGRAGTVIVVDHHPSNEGFGDIAVIDAEAGASAELAYRLIRAIGWPIGHDVALCLYTGIVTDTGRFQYSSTRPETHQIAAELLRTGVRPEVVGQSVYERVPFGYLALSTRVLGRATLDAGLRLVWSVMMQGDLEDIGLSYEDSDPLIDDLRIAAEADVALLLKEVESGFKGSLRSRGRVDVGAVAVSLGGGGHHNASGFTHPGPVATIVDRVRAAIS